MSPDTASLSCVAELFVDLARIPSPSGEERLVADRVLAAMREIGLEPDEDGTGPAVGSTMGNLYARIPGTRSGVPLFLCAHLDTVPPVAEIDPVVADGVISNRAGTILGADNKAAVAVMLEAARQAHEGLIEHAGLELVFTSREETGLLGAAAFDTGRLEARTGFVYDQADAIGTIVTGSPSIEHFRVEFHGRSAHAGMFPREGRSAVYAAARAVAALTVGEVDADTTCNIGKIGGGTAVNVVPDRCTVTGEIRSHDPSRFAEEVAAFRAAMESAAGEVGCTVEIDALHACDGYRFEADEPAVRLATEALERCGYPVKHVRSGGASDANAFNASPFNASSALRCLNLANAMVDIHTPDERIAVADLDGMLAVTLALLAAACA